MTGALEYFRARGLVEESVLGAVIPDIVRDRAWIPWRNAAGEEVYRKGRLLNGTGDGDKYMPWERGKRPPLYASPGAWESDVVALVEGEIDALLCAQAGTPAFATGGSALADEAVEILARKRLVLLVPDNDDAGRQWRDGRAAADGRPAIPGVVDKLLGHVPLVEVVLPDGVKDLGELAQLALETDQDPAEVVAELLDDARPLGQRTKALDVVELAELAAAADDGDYVIEAFMRRHSVTLILGEEGDGKTILAEQLCREVLRGEMVLDHFKPGSAAPRRILFVDTEMSEPEVRARCAELDARGLALRRGQMFWLVAGPLDLANDPGDRAYILSEIARVGADMVWIDSGGNAVDDPNEGTSVNALFDWSFELWRRGVVGIGVTHHFRKRSQDARGRRFDDSYGAREWKGRASKVFNVEGQRILCFKDRGNAIGQMWPRRPGRKYPEATLDRPGYDDPTARPFRIRYDPSDITEELATEVEEVRLLVLEKLAAEPLRHSKTSLAEAIKKRKKDVALVVEKLVEEGVIESSTGRKLRLVEHSQRSMLADEPDEYDAEDED